MNISTHPRTALKGQPIREPAAVAKTATYDGDNTLSTTV